MIEVWLVGNDSAIRYIMYMKRFSFSLATAWMLVLLTVESRAQSCLVTDDLRRAAGMFVSCGDPVTHEGHEYATVEIGGQCWFAENVRYLPSVSPQEDVGNEARAYVYGYSGADVDEAIALSSYEEYGVLYNHAAAVQWDVCPSGWHLSNHTEFYAMQSFLESNQGGKLKTNGTLEGGDGLWNAPNTGATNETGFSAKPGGYIHTGNGSIELGLLAHFWTPANAPGSSKQGFALRHNSGSLSLKLDHQNSGKSLRCVLD